MKKKIVILSLVFCLLLTSVFAHSGRTDSNGGHRDNKNISGLGSYHYHCGGYPAHLHTNGVCPYSTPKQTYTPSINSDSYASQTTPSNKMIVSKPSFPVKINNSDISNYCDKWSPFIYNDIVYIPMTSAVVNELSLTSSFDKTNGVNINKPLTAEKTNFLDNYVVIISANDQNTYHKYGCEKLDLSEFWIYNTELANSYGYQACPNCN